MSASPARPATAPVSSKPPSTYESWYVQKQSDSIQDERTTIFVHLNVLLTLGTRNVEKPVFSPLKVQVPQSSASVTSSSTCCLILVQQLSVRPLRLRIRMDQH